METSLLLAAVSDTSPCGEDLEYDSDFLQLERDALGRPERSMGDAIQAAEPPEWRQLEQACHGLLQRSKDLRITHYLLQSRLALRGVEGLADSLELILELLSRYWPEIHPQLDADDDNDPTVRINTLSGLTCETNLGLLRNAVLVRSRVFGNITLRAALNAAGLHPASSESLSVEELGGALQDADSESLQLTRDALGRALQSLDAIERLVSEQVGSAQGVELSALQQPLKLALQVLGDSPAGANVGNHPADTSAPAEASMQPASAHAAMRVSGEIANRDDVLKSLERILIYYARHEPSSPLPVLLNRARSLVNADFATIVRNLIPDGMSQFENLRGPDEY
ncbi:type VI secretion system protein TssA [Ectopseudomonas mendocina]|uniref:Type VI secretion system protein TssA n=1 Tax=Ectopseudomonas mendocina TaxID=300 RepID=A0ABD7RVV3_ECTME|nr:type VI secretion system protein TssA [Pseudomonas mendocina]TRO13544.1 type VI secretion system protein TssA [Pseudomonas mendocina]TRO18692.1 type VI secretion system protein TssA [Pseudomonas mendocina]